MKIWTNDRSNNVHTQRTPLEHRATLHRWKALDEIYKIYILLHRSDLNISEKNRQTFSAFFGKFLQIFANFDHVH